MKFNKWTLGLAAAGIVTLPSLTRAAAPIMVQTATENVTLSGYVDTSAQWNIGKGNNPGAPAYSFGGPDKADGFNLNVVDLALDKPLDETPWAAGYHAEFWFGPDANALATQSNGNQADFAIRQAYVTLRTPIGNGIDWKMGVFDSPLGYESTSSPNNPNYTRSYGYTIEPTELTGLMGTYKFCDEVSFTGGVVDTIDPVINERGPSEDTKAWLGSVTLTAPKSWGWLADSSFSSGVIHGFSSAAKGSSGNVLNLYSGVTLSTPVTALKVGAAFDYRHDYDRPDPLGDTWVYGLYASYQATEKLSFHARGEYMDDRDLFNGTTSPYKGFEMTITGQYDLWKNVLSRVECRWDHADNQTPFGGGTTLRNSIIFAANVVYKF